MATIPLATPSVSTATTRPTRPDKTDGKIDVSWEKIDGAGRYVVEIADGLNATTGFTIVDPLVTGTTKQIINKAAGDYTVGVTAMPVTED